MNSFCNNFYIYFHRDLETSEIVYVGLGRYDRAWSTKRARDNGHYDWLREVLPNLNAVEIYRTGLVEDEARTLELDLIAKFKPRFNKEPVKLTGTRNPRYIHGNRSKNRSKNPYYTPGVTGRGCKNADRKGNVGLPIFCINNNKYYRSTMNAARELGLDPSGITKVLKNRQKYTLGYSFKYVTLEEFTNNNNNNKE